MSLTTLFNGAIILVFLWGLSSSGRATALHAVGERFKSVRLHQYDSLAQLVEHLTFNEVVPGSSPGWVTKCE